MGVNELIAQKIAQLQKAADTAKVKLEKENSTHTDLSVQQNIALAKLADCKNELSVSKTLSGATNTFFTSYSDVESRLSPLSLHIEKEMLLFEQWHQHLLALISSTIATTKNALTLNDAVVKEKYKNKLISDDLVATVNKMAADAQNTQQLLLNLLPPAAATLNAFMELKYALQECQLLIVHWTDGTKGKKTSLQKAVDEAEKTAQKNEVKIQNLSSAANVALTKSQQKIAKLEAALQVSMAVLSAAHSAVEN